MKTTYSDGQVFFLVVLRMAIGWFILYQGLVKYFDPSWSAAGYLLSSKWILSGMFTAMAESSFWLGIVNFLNIYGQMAIGLGLILGLFTKVATISAIIMISLFYLAHPPLAQFESPGVEIIVNPLLIIVFSLCVLLLFPTSKIVGLDRLVFQKKPEKAATVKEEKREAAVTA
jgi:thiosulfate dehydrogenase (quinone) large subunit